MDLRLDGKRALVTGSTAGIGYAIAEGLAQEGAEVIVNGRSAKRVLQAADALKTRQVPVLLASPLISDRLRAS
jgi:NAD(P)-dependent dehydrogenase (short-subunit alcohol dehydrogenase family)